MNSLIEIRNIADEQPGEIEHHQAKSAVVGKDILELISVSMYVDPLTMYREYIQNATDAIDSAVEAGCLRDSRQGEISINLSLKNRSIVIRDNGCGVASDEFERVMLSFGNSSKRGQKARGFRGVGRFSGLAYCQNMIFRTKAKGEGIISEITWDGRKFRQILNNHDQKEKLEDLVSQVATVATYRSRKSDSPFFEVELNKLVRTKNDLLLNEEMIYDYLAQNCPVPYSESFSHKSELESFLQENGIEHGYDLSLTSDFHEKRRVYRPYRDVFQLSETESDNLTGAEKIYLESVHEGLSAIGWVFKHDYKGLIPTSENIRGIRVRVGNIQIGDEKVLAEAFPESRFNSWSIGELHILDSKIVPNGRRDNFEHNVHWLELQNQFATHAKEIARTCRKNSSERNSIKQFYAEKDRCVHILSVLKQSALSASKLASLRSEISLSLLKLEKLAVGASLSDSKQQVLSGELIEIRKLVDSPDSKKAISHGFFDQIPKNKRGTYKEVFDLIYDCSPNRVVAKSLIDKIIKTCAAKN